MLLFNNKSVYPFPVAHSLNPYHAEICVEWVCSAGWLFYAFFNVLFFLFRAKHQIIFLPNKQNLEENFHQHLLREYFPSSMLKIKLCTSRHTTAAKFKDESLVCYFELIVCVCIDVCVTVNIFAVMTRRFPVDLG